MSLFVQRYQRDPTGVDPANRVENELHTLPTTVKLIDPAYGYFYADSVEIFSLNTQTSIPSDQYTFTEYFEKESFETGKKIYGSILLLDDTLTGDILLTYQALGGINSKSTQNVLDVYYDRLQELEVVDYSALEDKPTKFKPTTRHYHPSTIIYDIGKAAKQLDGIKEALLVGSLPSVKAVMDYIDKIIASIEQSSLVYLDSELPRTLAKFKSQFTKQFFNLDKVSNIQLSRDTKVRSIGKDYFKQNDIDVNNYLSLSSLVYIKETLFDSFVNRLNTNIDMSEPNYMLPTKDNLFATLNGGNISYVGLDHIRTSQIEKDIDLYPVETYSSGLLTVTRITNNRSDRGGLFSLVDHTTHELFLGVHHDGDKTKNVTWKKSLTDGDLDRSNQSLKSHISNVGNPHRDTKYSIKLSDVENLRVVSDYDLANMLSSRTYITADNLLTFMEMFEAQSMWKVEALDTSGKFLLDNCQVVYSECGECGCSDRSDFPDVPPPPIEVCPAANTLLREFCSNSATNTPPLGSNTILGLNRYGVYTDGYCGETTRLIETNSLTCGYVRPGTGGTVEIRDGSGRLIGMGYGPTDDKDPNATVRLDNYDGGLICYIYPKSGDGYDSAILDIDGSFIGFAINP